MTRRSRRRHSALCGHCGSSCRSWQRLPIVAPLAWLWQASRVPASYSVMDMGYLDYGGRAMPDPGGGHGGHMQGHMPDDRSESRLITDLVVDPARPADVRVELVARQQALSNW